MTNVRTPQEEKNEAIKVLLRILSEEEEQEFSEPERWIIALKFVGLAKARLMLNSDSCALLLRHLIDRYD